MSMKYAIPVTLFLLLATLCPASGHQLSFGNEAVTFTNSFAEAIVLSRKQLVLRGHIYRSHNCSNSMYYCYAYGRNVLVIVAPKLCAPFGKWHVTGLQLSWDGVMPHHPHLQALSKTRTDTLYYIYDDRYGISALIFNRNSGERNFSDFYYPEKDTYFLPCKTAPH